MRSFKGYISQLSTAEKVELFSLLYKDIADCGTDGDTKLAHVNPAEAAWLKSFGGSGTRNPITGLPQFGGGSPPPPAATSTVTQQATIPDELKPYITDILEKSKGVQERREEEGYVPFEGPRIAEFSPEQEQAFTGVQGLVGAGQPSFDTASGLAQAGTQAATPEGLGQFMSPYMQNVVDIQKREALQDSALVGNQIGASAVQGAGGFGGSRQAILEAEHGRNTLQNLSDIQERGQQAAYGDAINLFNNQKGRELAGSQQFANLGSQAPGQAMKEFAALEGVGSQRQGQSQQALNIAQDEYEIARTFPERSLQDYNAIVRGYSSPLPASTYNRAQTQNPGTSGMQNLSTIAGLGLTGAKMFGGFKDGGTVGLAEGGTPSGLSSLQGLLKNMPVGIALNPIMGAFNDAGIPTGTMWEGARKEEEERQEELIRAKQAKANERSLMEKRLAALESQGQGTGAIALAGGGSPRFTPREQRIIDDQEGPTYANDPSVRFQDPDSLAEYLRRLKQEEADKKADVAKKTQSDLPSILKPKVVPARPTAKPAAKPAGGGIAGKAPTAPPRVRQSNTPARDKLAAMSGKRYEEEAGIMGRQKDRADDQLGNLAKFALDFGAADPTEGNIRGLAKAGRGAADRVDAKGDKSAALELAMAGQSTKGAELAAANEKEDRTVALAYAKIRAGNRLDVKDAVSLVGKLQSMNYSPDDMMAKLLMFQTMSRGDPVAEATFEEEIQRQRRLNSERKGSTDKRPNPNRSTIAR
jgi:hypothetical protein|tara:strand:- start:1280 stop:3547 length:2268 start_codon:yes stop_codon:yes gene_type:complete